MGRVILLFITVLMAALLNGRSEEELLNVQRDKLSPEFVTVRNLAISIKLLLKDNPGKQIVRIDDLSDYVDPARLDHKYAWLPLAQRYAFLRPGSGSVLEPDGGQVLVVCTVPLSKYELEDTSDPDPAKNPPGRYIIWKADGGEVYHRWYPENELRQFVRPDVLDSITLPKPTVPPRQRISTTVVGSQDPNTRPADPSGYIPTAEPPLAQASANSAERRLPVWPWIAASSDFSPSSCCCCPGVATES